MAKYAEEEYQVVDITPEIIRYRCASYWRGLFESIPDGKALMFTYNNRQRARQVANKIRTSAHYHHIYLGTRIIHGTPEIHDTDKWLLYIWRKPRETA